VLPDQECQKIYQVFSKKLKNVQKTHRLLGQLTILSMTGSSKKDGFFFVGIEKLNQVFRFDVQPLFKVQTKESSATQTSFSLDVPFGGMDTRR
jgi:hypothetical protein